YAGAIQSGSGRIVADGRSEARARTAELRQCLALLELGSIERSRFHWPACYDDLSRTIQAASMDAGDPLRGQCFAPHAFCRRRFCVPSDDRLGPRVQTATRRGGSTLSSATEPGRFDSRSSRWLRLQPVREIREY